MDTYSLNGSVAAVAATPGKTALSLIASSLTRARVHYWVVSVGGTPVADNILNWLVRRFTAVGTGTAATPAALDGDGPGSQLTALSNLTVEPTFTTTIFDIAIHQRSLFQWNASPGGEVVLPAVAARGLAITPIHASYAGSAQATMHWKE